MCADFIKIDTPLYSKHDIKPQIYADSKYATNIFNQFHRFYDEGKFTDFELSGYDRKK